MIHTLTFNPSIDVSLQLDRLRLGEAQRLPDPEEFPGGKGVNVTRALTQLGHENVAWVFLGGFRGTKWERLAGSLGVDIRRIDLLGETRQNIKIFESAESRQTDLNLPGPLYEEKPFHQFLEIFPKLLTAGDYVVLAGSGLPQTPVGFWIDLSRAIEEREARLIVDTTGAPLRALVEGRPWMIKLNREEYSELVGRDLPNLREIVQDHRDHERFTGSHLLITDGPRGSLGIDRNSDVCQRPGLEVEVAGTVGAGDAATAGFLAGWIESKESWIEAVAMANATAAGAVELPGTQFPSRQRVLELRGEDRDSGRD
jgi:1-phosphofructokinase